MALLRHLITLLAVGSLLISIIDASETFESNSGFLSETDFSEIFKKVQRKDGLEVSEVPHQRGLSHAGKKMLKLLRRRPVADASVSESQVKSSTDWDSIPEFSPSDWSSSFDFGQRFEQDEAQDRSDVSAPLFRGVVERVLDNRELRPNKNYGNFAGQDVPEYDEVSRIDFSRPSRPVNIQGQRFAQPQRATNRQGLRSDARPSFGDSTFSIPSEIRSQVEFENDDITDFRAPFGNSGDGFANFLRQVGSRPDAFGSQRFNNRNDPTVESDGVVHSDRPFQNGRTSFPRQRARYESGFDEFEEDEFDRDAESPDDDDEDYEDDEVYVKRYKPTVKKTSTTYEEDKSFFDFDKHKSAELPANVKSDKPYSYSYHIDEPYGKAPQAYFHKERSFQTVKGSAEAERFQLQSYRQPISSKTESSVSSSTLIKETTLNDFKQPEKPPSFNSYSNLVIDELSTLKAQSSTEFPRFNIKGDLKKLPEFSTKAFEDDEPSIKNGFFSNPDIQDFRPTTPTPLPPVKQTTSTVLSSRQDERIKPFQFQPFQNFDSFFANDLESKAEFDKNNFFGFRELFKPSQFISPDDVLPITTSAIASSKPTLLPSTSSSSIGTTTIKTTTITVPKTFPTTTPATLVTTVPSRPTPSEIYYKEVDRNDPRFTPGPVYYKDIELVTDPSAFSSSSTSTTSTSTTTTEGWKPRIDENIPSERQSYDAPLSKPASLPTVQTYSSPVEQSYSAPTAESYSAPTAESFSPPVANTDPAPAGPSYEAPESDISQSSISAYSAPSNNEPSVDSYGAPVGEPYTGDSYGAPKGEPLQGPPSPRASATPLKAEPGYKRSLRPQYRNPALGPLFNGVHKVRSIVEDSMQRIRKERNNPILRSAAVIIPYAVTLL